MTLQFEHLAPRQRVLFCNGNATADLAAETERLQARNAMVISTSRYADVAGTITEGVNVALRYHDVVEHIRPRRRRQPGRLPPPTTPTSWQPSAADRPSDWPRPLRQNLRSVATADLERLLISVWKGNTP